MNRCCGAGKTAGAGSPGPTVKRLPWGYLGSRDESLVLQCVVQAMRPVSATKLQCPVDDSVCGGPQARSRRFEPSRLMMKCVVPSDPVMDLIEPSAASFEPRLCCNRMSRPWIGLNCRWGFTNSGCRRMTLWVCVSRSMTAISPVGGEPTMRPRAM